MSGHKPKHTKNDAAAHRHQEQAEKESTNRHVYVEPGVQIDLVQDLKQKYESAQQDNTAHNKKVLRWTQVSAVLFFISAALASKTVIDERDRFIRDQRPTMWIIKPFDEIGNDARSGKFAWNIHYKNFGKSPAFHLRNDIRLLTGKDAINGIKDIDKVPMEKGQSLEPPGGADDFASGMIPSLTKAEIDDLSKIDNGIVVYGRIDYTDAAGTEYWSLFCMGRQANGVVAYCPNYNRVK